MFLGVISSDLDSVVRGQNLDPVKNSSEEFSFDISEPDSVEQM